MSEFRQLCSGSMLKVILQVMQSGISRSSFTNNMYKAKYTSETNLFPEVLQRNNINCSPFFCQHHSSIMTHYIATVPEKTLCFECCLFANSIILVIFKMSHLKLFMLEPIMSNF